VRRLHAADALYSLRRVLETTGVPGAGAESAIYACRVVVQVINKGGITYKGTPWHRECFTCTGCNKVLVGEKFTSRDEKPFCADCFAQQFAKKCIRCTQPITGQQYATKVFRIL